MAGHVSFTGGTSSSFGHLQDDSDTQDRLLDNVHQARSSLGTYTVGESSMQSVTIPPGRTSLQDVGGHHSRAESAHAGHATATTTVGVAPLMQCQEDLQAFWPSVNEKMKHLTQSDYKVMELPLARIKKIMKQDDDVKMQMISAEVPMLFSKAAEIFISELTLRSWIHTEENKRRTLQRNDIALAVGRYDQFDFLIDIVPREDWRAGRPRQQDQATESAFAAYYQTLQALQQQYNPQGQLGSGDGAPLDSAAVSQLLQSLQTLSSFTSMQQPQPQQEDQQQARHQHSQLQMDDHEVAQTFQDAVGVPGSSSHTATRNYYSGAGVNRDTPILDVVGDDDSPERNPTNNVQLPSAGAHFVHQITSNASRSATSHTTTADASDYSMFNALPPEV